MPKFLELGNFDNISPPCVAISPAQDFWALPARLTGHAARYQDWVSANPLGAASASTTTSL